MSGIPVYTSSPLKAPKASAVTPQTSAPQSNTVTSAPATTTATSTSSYPPAQPGNAAFPGPTTAAQRYAPVQPTPTSKSEPEGPPAPQPGAVPTPLNKSTVPPPPKAGESYRRSQQTVAPGQPYPPQMAIPPPTNAYGSQVPTSSTSTSASASVSYPASIPAEYETPRRSLEHPPGYSQNPYASEVTSQQRRAQEANHSNSDSDDHAGGLDAEGVWNTAKRWVATAGEKISEAEAEVWRRVNKE